MSQSTIRAALTTHITGLNLGHPIRWPNQPNWVTPSNQTWLRVTYLLGEKSQLSLRQTDILAGVVQVDIFTPKSSGSASAYTIADKLDAGFSRLSPIKSGGVTINTVSVTPAEPRDDDPWWRLTFSATIRCMMDKL